MLAMIEARAAGKELPKGETRAAVRDNVVNLMDVLQKSLEASKKRGESPPHAGRDRTADDGEADAPKKKVRRKSSAA